MPDLPKPLRFVRPEDLLVLDIELTNLHLSDDGQRLERIEPGSPAVFTVHLPSQHVAERVFFERLVVTEEEHLAVDEQTPGQGGVGARVVYADVLEV